MKQTVYVDVLLSINLMVDYFLLYAAAVLAGRRRDRVRMCLGAVIGAAGSLVMLLPRMPPAATLLLTAVISALMTAAAFKWSGRRSFAYTLLVLYVLSAGYSGAMLLIWSLTGADKIIINNGAVYIDIKPGHIVLTTVVFYAVMSLFSGRIRAKGLSRRRCTVTITENDTKVAVDGLIDTGNMLTEPFSGLPVLVASRRAVAAVLPDGLDTAQLLTTSEMSRRVRLVPYHTAAGSGLMTAFMPKRIDIDIDGRSITEVSAYIALATDDEQLSCGIIVNPDAASQ